MIGFLASIGARDIGRPFYLPGADRPYIFTQTVIKGST